MNARDATTGEMTTARRKTVRRVLVPQQDTCPACGKPLSLYKRYRRRRIHDLTVDLDVTIEVRACYRENCPRSVRHVKQPKKSGVLYYPDEHDKVSVFHSKLTHELWFHVAHLRFIEKMHLREIQQHLVQQHALRVDIVTISNWIELYEASCMALTEHHADMIREQMQHLPQRVWLIDATQEGSSSPLYRIIEWYSGFHLAATVITSDVKPTLTAFVEDTVNRFGRPDLVVFDGEDAIRAALTEVMPEVPQQRCAMHVIKNVTDRVLNALEARAQRSLSRLKYKKRTRAIISRLKKVRPLETSPRGQVISLLAAFCLQATPPREIIERTSLEKIRQLVALSHGLDVMNAVLFDPHVDVDGTELAEFFTAEERQRLQEWKDLQGDIKLLTNEDPYHQALLELHALLKEIREDKIVKELLSEYERRQKDLMELRGIFWEATRAANQELVSDEFWEQFPEPLRTNMREAWQRRQHDLEKQLSRLTPGQRRFKKVASKNHQHVKDQADRALETLIAAWERKSSSREGYREAITILRGARGHLFFTRWSRSHRRVNKCSRPITGF